MDLPSKQISKGQGIASQVEFEPDAKVVQTHFGGQTSLKAGDDILFGIREKPSKASPSSVSGGNDNMYQDPEEFIQTSRGFHATSTTPNWYIPLPPPPPPPPKSRILWLILVVCLVAFLGGSAMTYTFLKDKNFTGHVFGLQQPTPLPTPFQPSQTL